MTDPDDDKPGFHYTVSDEQIRVFSSLTVGQRLQWLEEMREWTWNLASPETRASWRKLREHRPPPAPAGKPG